MGGSRLLNGLTGGQDFLTALLALAAVWRIVTTLGYNGWFVVLYLIGLAGPALVVVGVFGSMWSLGTLDGFTSLEAIVLAAWLATLVKFASPAALWLISARLRRDDRIAGPLRAAAE